MSFASISRFHKRIGVRLVLWYSAFFVGTGVAVGLISYRYLASTLRDNRAVITDRIEELKVAADSGRAGAVEQMVDRSRSRGRKNAILFRLLDGSGRPVLVGESGQWREFDSMLQDRKGLHPGWQHVLSSKDGDVLELATVQLQDGRWLQVGKIIEDRKEILERYRETVIGVISGMVVLGLAGGAFLAFRALRPIRHLALAMQAIVATGRMDARVPESGVGDELDQLTSLFNKMLERIQNLVNNMRDALDNVAHDLRTPLARIRGAAEVALQDESDSDQLRDVLSSNIEESDHVLALLNALMDISEAESGSMRLQLEEVSLRELIDQVVELYQDSAAEAEISLSVTRDHDVMLSADRTRLRQVIANLLDNAIKYSRPGGKVIIDVRQTQDRIAVSFQDEGIGIGPEEIAKVWDRLYRGDASRSQPGLGLGLSVVRAVVRAHQGDVGVRSVPREGSTFTIFLPQLTLARND